MPVTVNRPMLVARLTYHRQDEVKIKAIHTCTMQDSFERLIAVLIYGNSLWLLSYYVRKYWLTRRVQVFIDSCADRDRRLYGIVPKLRASQLQKATIRGRLT